MASLRSSFSRMVEKPLDGRDKVTHLEWLALKRVESGVCSLLPVGGHHRRGHRHDGNLSGGLLGSQLADEHDHPLCRWRLPQGATQRSVAESRGSTRPWAFSL